MVYRIPRQEHQCLVELVPLGRSAVTLLCPLEARTADLLSSRRQCLSLISPAMCSGRTPGAPGTIRNTTLRWRSTRRRCVSLALSCFFRADLRSIFCGLAAPGWVCVNTGSGFRSISDDDRARCPASTKAPHHDLPCV